MSSRNRAEPRAAHCRQPRRCLSSRPLLTIAHGSRAERSPDAAIVASLLAEESSSLQFTANLLRQAPGCFAADDGSHGETTHRPAGWTRRCVGSDWARHVRGQRRSGHRSHRIQPVPEAGRSSWTACSPSSSPEMRPSSHSTPPSRRCVPCQTVNSPISQAHVPGCTFGRRGTLRIAACSQRAVALAQIAQVLRGRSDQSHQAEVARLRADGGGIDSPGAPGADSGLVLDRVRVRPGSHLSSLVRCASDRVGRWRIGSQAACGSTIGT